MFDDFDSDYDSGYDDSYDSDSRDGGFWTGSYSSDESEYANDGHPGTKPDDPMFGWDPWDDEDDAYDIERDFSDPYPNYMDPASRPKYRGLFGDDSDSGSGGLFSWFKRRK